MFGHWVGGGGRAMGWYSLGVSPDSDGWNVYSDSYFIFQGRSFGARRVHAIYIKAVRLTRPRQAVDLRFLHLHLRQL